MSSLSSSSAPYVPRFPKMTATVAVDTFDNVNTIDIVPVEVIDDDQTVKQNDRLLTIDDYVSTGTFDIECDVMSCHKLIDLKDGLTCSRCTQEVALINKLKYSFGDIDTCYYIKIELGAISENRDSISCDNCYPFVVAFKQVVYLPAFEQFLSEYYALMDSSYGKYNWNYLYTLNCDLIRYSHPALRFYSKLLEYNSFESDDTCNCNNIVSIIAERISVVPAYSDLTTSRFYDFLPKYPHNATIEDLLRYYSGN